MVNLSLLLVLQLLYLSRSSLASECLSSSNNNKYGECLDSDGSIGNNGGDGACLDASLFQQRVASFFANDANNGIGGDRFMLQSLRGSVDGVLSQHDVQTLVELLPMNDFVEAAGYDVNDNTASNDMNNGNAKMSGGRAYSAPTGYAGIGLKELSRLNSNRNSKTSHEDQERRYSKLLQIRETVRSTTEKKLNLCPGTLLIDFTTISQKTEGGAHRPHADNCLHYFRDVSIKEGTSGTTMQKVATCDPNRNHPYPNRVAASILYLNDPITGNYGGGQFYFANRTNHGEVEEDGQVDIALGRMIYFTSGVESLHGAMPVVRRDNKEPRRLALAMWYVVDPLLEEYVPPFNRDKNDQPEQSTTDNASKLQKQPKPKTKFDPNDPDAPKDLFAIPIPNSIYNNMDALLQSMGSYLVSKQNSPTAGSWKVNRYGEDALHVLFKDNSAMFSLDFGVAVNDSGDSGEAPKFAQSSVVVERHTDGKKPPSLQYQLQESVILHGVLDELEKLLFEGADVDSYKEYAKVEFEKARRTLPARRA